MPILATNFFSAMVLFSVSGFGVFLIDVVSDSIVLRCSLECNIVKIYF